MLSPALRNACQNICAFIITHYYILLAVAAATLLPHTFGAVGQVRISSRSDLGATLHRPLVCSFRRAVLQFRKGCASPLDETGFHKQEDENEPGAGYTIFAKCASLLSVSSALP
jgi:hypothetical protein